MSEPRYAVYDSPREGYVIVKTGPYRRSMPLTELCEMLYVLNAERDRRLCPPPEDG